MSGRAVDPIRVTVDVAADPSTAWRHLIEPELVATWFTDASPVGAPGTDYRLDFGDGSVVAGVVRELDPGRSFGHDWQWEGAADVERTFVRWTVLPAGSGSRIILEHEGWGPDDGSVRDEHAGYWTSYVEDLVAVLSPDPPRDDAA